MHRIPIALGLLVTLATIGFGWSRVGDRSATVADSERVPTPVPPGEGELETPVVWQGVDLREVRAALPNNRYWTVGLPTTDEGVLAARARAADAHNQLLGKILSGNATDDEIAAYFDAQQRLNEDYVAFARYVLGRYRGVLTDRDVGMLELAQAMNEQRLAQLPDERLRAFARKSEQDRARAAWNDLHRPGG